MFTKTINKYIACVCYKPFVLIPRPSELNFSISPVSSHCPLTVRSRITIFNEYYTNNAFNDRVKNYFQTSDGHYCTAYYDARQTKCMIDIRDLFDIFKFHNNHFSSDLRLYFRFFISFIY